ncbi:MAG: ribonuclease HII [Synergistaceae bacterium]|nr:ribonuclease HII [Synergistaceae bacterium]
MTDGVAVGTDEAGRGPLAGPVVAAAVILTPQQERALLDMGLRDSKKMSPSGREAVFAAMQDMGVAWRARSASVEEIEAFNILRASLLAMGRSVSALLASAYADFVVVDGLFGVPGVSLPQFPVVSADSRFPAVSAASVAAKVLRDRVMAELDRFYPVYGFARHKGYPTREHREAVRTWGMSPMHRVKFCRKLLEVCNGGNN